MAIVWKTWKEGAELGPGRYVYVPDTVKVERTDEHGAIVTGEYPMFSDQQDRVNGRDFMLGVLNELSEIAQALRNLSDD